MIDVNLGNKTLVVGVAIALILSYGMVNFNGGKSQANLAFPTVEAASYSSPQPVQAAPAVTEYQATDSTTGIAPSATDAGELDAEALAVVQQSRSIEVQPDDSDDRNPRRRVRHN